MPFCVAFGALSCLRPRASSSSVHVFPLFDECRCALQTHAPQSMICSTFIAVRTLPPCHSRCCFPACSRLLLFVRRALAPDFRLSRLRCNSTTIRVRSFDGRSAYTSCRRARPRFYAPVARRYFLASLDTRALLSWLACAPACSPSAVLLQASGSRHKATRHKATRHKATGHSAIRWPSGLVHSTAGQRFSCPATPAFPALLAPLLSSCTTLRSAILGFPSGYARSVA